MLILSPVCTVLKFHGSWKCPGTLSSPRFETTTVALGACIVEKHLTLTRRVPGPDSDFSLEPDEFKAMVDSIRTAEKAMGEVRYQATEKEKASRVFRRSLFVVKDVKVGEAFTEDNVRSIRPGYGLHPRSLDQILGRFATRDIEFGTPLRWEDVGANYHASDTPKFVSG